MVVLLQLLVLFCYNARVVFGFRLAFGVFGFLVWVLFADFGGFEFGLSALVA